MPKKPDPSFDDEFQDDEVLSDEFDDDTSDEGDGDEEYDEDYDEEYDEDYDDDESPKGSWVKKALFATIGLGVVGVGAYFVINNFLPASKPAADNGPYANPGGLGKVVKATPVAQEAAATETTTAEATAAATPVAEATKAPEAKPVKTAAKPAVTAQPVQETVATPAPQVAPVHKAHRQRIAKRVVAQPAHKHLVAKKPVVTTPVAQKAPKAQPASVKVAAQPKTTPGGHFTLQVGAFAQLSNAESLVKVLNAKGIPARMTGGGHGTTVSSTGTYAVRSTVVNSRAKADQLVNTFAKSGHPSMLVAQGNGKYSVQLGVFSSRDRAQSLATELKQKGMFVSINSKTVTHRHSTGGGLCKVYAGDYSTMDAAKKAMTQLRAQNIPAVVAKQ